MQTSTSNSSINYKTSKATTSNKNSINASVDTSSTQTLNTSSTRNVETETVDLSSETNESKGIFETIGDGIAAAGATIGEAASDFINNVETIIGKADDLISSNPITKAITDIYSTKAVIGTSVLSGLLKIAENVEDGKKWAEGKMIEAGAYVAGQVVGLFSEEAKESIDSWRKDFSTSIKEDIAIDKVGEANKWFYEETELGRRINAHSAIKYDSEAAKKIQGISKTAGEIAAATGLTIITGGTAAPFIIGAMAGAGSAAESTYQKGTDTTILQELGIGVSGALTGLTWIANGKLGQGAIEIGKDIFAKGGLTVLKEMGAQVFNKEFILSKLKEGLSLTNAGKINFNALFNYGQAAMGTASSIVPYITGEEEFDLTAAVKITGTFLGYLGLNVLEDMARDFVSGYKSSGPLNKITNEIPEKDMDPIPEPTSATKTSSGIETKTPDTSGSMDVKSPKMQELEEMYEDGYITQEMYDLAVKYNGDIPPEELKIDDFSTFLGRDNQDRMISEAATVVTEHGIETRYNTTDGHDPTIVDIYEELTGKSSGNFLMTHHFEDAVTVRYIVNDDNPEDLVAFMDIPDNPNKGVIEGLKELYKYWTSGDMRGKKLTFGIVSSNSEELSKVIGDTERSNGVDVSKLLELIEYLSNKK